MTTPNAVVEGHRAELRGDIRRISYCRDQGLGFLRGERFNVYAGIERVKGATECSEVDPISP